MKFGYAQRGLLGDPAFLPDGEISRVGLKRQWEIGVGEQTKIIIYVLEDDCITLSFAVAVGLTLCKNVYEENGRKFKTILCAG